MKRKYIIVDSLNTFMRAKHVASKSASLEENIAFSVHLMLSSVGKCWREFQADHIVFCMEGRSWRKDFYRPYKANRAAKRSELSPKELEEDAMFFEAYQATMNYLAQKTNCTILQHPEAEADDLIARWIMTTPNAEHIIISSDSDYHQLIAENVTQYNGITDEFTTLDGIFNSMKKPVIDKKTKIQKTIGDPEWVLFEKCMRGDTSDNVFSAYPGVREKSSKNKIGLREAYDNRLIKGFAWNTIMQSVWIDRLGVQHKVQDDYLRNKHLIDLKAQPDELKTKFDEAIQLAKIVKTNPSIGLYFLKFCGKFKLQRLSEQPTFYSEMLSASY